MGRRSRCWIVLGIGVAGLSGSPPTSAAGTTPDDPYGDPQHWVCRPDRDDVCDAGLDSTSIAADGALTEVPFTASADAPIDCFYVYPTISRDPGTNSDLDAAAAEEGFAAINQVAPLGTACRVFAPVYRQVTLTALTAALGGAEVDPAAREIAYADVLAAWRHYLSHDNGGRGVVLVGHSQGAGIVTQLVAAEVERDSSQLDLLVSVIVAGSSVQVPLGGVVGGDFTSVPVCESAEQFGCVVSWASYRSTAPPPEDAYFGAPGDGTEAVCTNPAAIGGGDAELSVRFPSSTGSSILSDLGTGSGDGAWVDPSVADVDTAFVELPGLVTAHCVSWDGRNWLEVTVHGDPADPRADDISGDLTPPWGLHLIDMNLVMGDLQRLVASQGASWLSAR